MNRDEIDKIIDNKDALNSSINICDVLDDELNKILDKDTPDKKTILVLSGGGTKGLAHLGAITVLKEKDLLKNFHTYACTSAGGLIGLLITCGYSGKDLLEITIMIGMSNAKSPETSNILTEFGFDSGERFMMILGKLVKAKGFHPDFTFRDHYTRTHKKLILTGSCINNKKPYYFSVDTEPDMSVLTAVRISMAVPLFFTPVIYKGNMFLDGGCMDNYPISLFKDRLDNVMGIYVSDKASVCDKIEHLEGFLANTIECLFEGSTRNSYMGYEEYTVMIQVDISALDFNLNDSTTRRIYDVGYKTMLKTLRSDE